MRVKTGLIFSLFVFLSAAVGAGSSDVRKSFQGEWQGTGTQSDGSQWQINIHVRKDGYFIDYPSLACGGVLRFVEAKANRLVFREILTYGLDQCLKYGDVVIEQLNKGKARYYWSSKQSSVTAEGQLSREVTDKKTK